MVAIGVIATLPTTRILLPQPTHNPTYRCHHCLDMNHMLRFDYCEIIHKCNKYHQRFMLESLYIKQDKLSMNLRILYTYCLVNLSKWQYLNVTIFEVCQNNFSFHVISDYKSRLILLVHLVLTQHGFRLDHSHGIYKKKIFLKTFINVSLIIICFNFNLQLHTSYNNSYSVSHFLEQSVTSYIKH